MKKSNEEKFKKDYFKKAITGFLIAWISLILFIYFFEFTKLNVFIIFTILNIIDLYLTHTIIFKRGFNIGNEANPIVRLAMRKFKGYWFIPLFLFVISLFYILFIKFNPNEVTFIFMGIYIMIVMNNFQILMEDKVLEENNLEMKSGLIEPKEKGII